MGSRSSGVCLLHLMGQCNSCDQDRLPVLAVDSADTASQIVFAGIRFALAGILVLLFASIREKELSFRTERYSSMLSQFALLRPSSSIFSFYIGVAHTSGVKGGIITGLGNFIAILMACLLVRNEKMTGRKLAGCILGFAGVVIINMAGGSMDMGFRLTGEGFVLIAQLSYGASTVLINIFSKKVSPVILSGCQFFMGGVLLFIVGILMGGHLDHMSIAGVVLILYLAMVSAVAYTLWSVLLAHNEVSKVAIFGFVNPLCSVVLSALVLGEVNQMMDTIILNTALPSAWNTVPAMMQNHAIRQWIPMIRSAGTPIFSMASDALNIPRIPVGYLQSRGIQ